MGVAAALAVSAPAASAGACSCGLAQPPGGTAEANTEQAIVSFDGTTESILLRPNFSGGLASAGLIIPTPSPATVSEGNPLLFDAVASEIVPTVETRNDWWGSPDEALEADDPAEPVVVDRAQFGATEAITLAAGDSAGLDAWLAAEGFEITPELRELLPSYVERGWSFVAVRVTSPGSGDGVADPVLIEFATDTVVYPLSLAQASSSPQRIRLNLLGDTQQALGFLGSEGVPESNVIWSGPVTSPALVLQGQWLTVVQLDIADPAGQGVDDLTVEPTSSSLIAPSYTVTNPIQFLGLPAGLVLVAAGVLLVASIAFGTTSMRSDSQRRAADAEALAALP